MVWQGYYVFDAAPLRKMGEVVEEEEEECQKKRDVSYIAGGEDPCGAKPKWEDNAQEEGTPETHQMAK